MCCACSRRTTAICRSAWWVCRTWIAVSKRPGRCGPCWDASAMAASRAASRILTYGFQELGLEAVAAWTVEINVPSRRALEHLHFRFVGRQRRCHWIDGKPYDRLLYDLLATEHVPDD